MAPLEAHDGCLDSEAPEVLGDVELQELVALLLDHSGMNDLPEAPEASFKTTDSMLYYFLLSVALAQTDTESTAESAALIARRWFYWRLDQLSDHATTTEELLQHLCGDKPPRAFLFVLAQRAVRDPFVLQNAMGEASFLHVLWHRISSSLRHLQRPIYPQNPGPVAARMSGPSCELFSKKDIRDCFGSCRLLLMSRLDMTFREMQACIDVDIPQPNLWRYLQRCDGRH